jgi:hypothetical protein
MIPDDAGELYGIVAPMFDGLDEAALIEGTLRDMCFYTVQIKGLQRTIEREGSIVDTPKGDRPHPAATLMHQYMADKNACLKTLLPLLKATGRKDALMEFLNG